MRDYFVIFYDSETKRLVVDDDQATEKYPFGLMRDSISGAWFDQNEYEDVDAEASKAVESCMDLYNKVLKNLEKTP